jgi:hypothetical protein
LTARLPVSRCVAQYTPDFGYEMGFSQTASSTVLTVVRPIAHATWPISTTGPTWMAFATGTAGSNSLSYHSSSSELHGVGDGWVRI